MLIRPATIDDTQGIAETNVEAWNWAYQGVVPAEMLAQRTVEFLAERIRNGWKDHVLNLVAVDQNGKVIGHAREQSPPELEGYDAEVGSLYVRPEHARQGIGQALLTEITRKMAEKGAKSLCIRTLRDNQVGRSFYDRMGGTVVADGQWGSIPSVWYAWPDITNIH